MTVFDQQWWEERYRSAPALFSGRVNPQVALEAADLPPGRALDAGCGEGADALWLADRGWDVLAVDISTVALDRAATDAERRGLSGRVRFEQADLTRWTPAGRFDLVTCSYVHATEAVRGALYARLAGAVAPGGTLLLVQHDPREGADVHPELLDMFATAEELAAELDPAAWDVVAAGLRPRAARHHGRDSDRPDGNRPDGNRPDGHEHEGHQLDGHQLEGHQHEGHQHEAPAHVNDVVLVARRR